MNRPSPNSSRIKRALADLERAIKAYEEARFDHAEALGMCIPANIPEKSDAVIDRTWRRVERQRETMHARLTCLQRVVSDSCHRAAA